MNHHNASLMELSMFIIIGLFRFFLGHLIGWLPFMFISALRSPSLTNMGLAALFMFVLPACWALGLFGKNARERFKTLFID